MASRSENVVHYRRARFSTRLPVGLLYTASHYWLKRQADGPWRVGFTQFATRMLGDPVDLDFEIEPDTQVKLGQLIGWVEGFKAVTDVFCAANGRFAGPNPAMEKEIELIDSDPYGRGWLYLVDGEPDPDGVDAEGYAKFLDATIDEMTGRS